MSDWMVTLLFSNAGGIKGYFKGLKNLIPGANKNEGSEVFSEEHEFPEDHLPDGTDLASEIGKTFCVQNPSSRAPENPTCIIHNCHSVDYTFCIGNAHSGTAEHMFPEDHIRGAQVAEIGTSVFFYRLAEMCMSSYKKFPFKEV